MKLDGKTILITGGTGYFGNAFTEYLITNHKPKKIIIYSRDEHKQEEMAKYFNQYCMRFFLGDVRDRERFCLALEGVDYVIHAAALKRVPALEYNPTEAVDTNITGTMNVISCCKTHNIKQAVFLSTDKAVAPANLYGKTKAVAEHLWLTANFNHIGYNVVRYGNVMGSRGSVLPIFQKIKEEGKDTYPITHPDMTRFWVNVKQAIDMVMTALSSPPGVILIPKCPAFLITDCAKALYNRAKLDIIGIRPGEKIHETLINSSEVRRTYEAKTHYFIVPEMVFDEKIDYGRKDFKTFEGTEYNSLTARRLSQSDIRGII